VHEDELVLMGARSMIVSPVGTLGHRYTSDSAPRLTREQFLAMLKEAETYD
jgi:hypothetical protein